jgi:hypothetical protein
LGRYTEDPDKFTIEFQTLALGFDLSWRNDPFLLANCCTPTIREKILGAAHREADEALARDHIGQHPGDITVPTTEPYWDYNTPGGMQRRVHMLEAILCGKKSGATKPINYSKVKGLIQKQEMNPISCYDRLQEAFRKFNDLDPESFEGTALLNHHFVNQSASDIRQKLQKLNLGPPNQQNSAGR